MKKREDTNKGGGQGVLLKKLHQTRGKLDSPPWGLRNDRIVREGKSPDLEEYLNGGKQILA